MPGPHFLTTHKVVNIQISVSGHCYDNHRNLLTREHILSCVEAFFVQRLRHLMNMIGCGLAEMAVTQIADLGVFAFPTYYSAEICKNGWPFLYPRPKKPAILERVNATKPPFV